MTPTRLREIASQLEKSCSSYQEKIMQSRYLPCKTCAEMAHELRKYAETLGPQIVAGRQKPTAPISALTESADHLPTESANG